MISFHAARFSNAIVSSRSIALARPESVSATSIFASAHVCCLWSGTECNGLPHRFWCCCQLLNSSKSSSPQMKWWQSSCASPCTLVGDFGHSGDGNQRFNCRNWRSFGGTLALYCTNSRHMDRQQVLRMRPRVTVSAATTTMPTASPWTGLSRGFGTYKRRKKRAAAEAKVTATDAVESKGASAERAKSPSTSSKNVSNPTISPSNVNPASAVLRNRGLSIRGDVERENSLAMRTSTTGVHGVVAVDTKTLYDPDFHLVSMPDFNDPSLGYETSTPLTDELMKLIAVGGPITFEEYMRQALTHPTFGYYTSTHKLDDFDDLAKGGEDDDQNDAHLSTTITKNIIGRHGDFITAPEISQVFGESILVWLVSQWEAMQRPNKLTLIEMGPGHGTLMADVLTAAVRSFPHFVDALCDGGGIHLVESSFDMRRCQAETLGNALQPSPYMMSAVDKEESGVAGVEVLRMGEIASAQHGEVTTRGRNDELKDLRHFSQGSNKVLHVHWHSMLATVPADPEQTGPQFVVAQEFVDALPVHSFQKTEDGLWREQMVDVDSTDRSNVESINDVAASDCDDRTFSERNFDRKSNSSTAAATSRSVAKKDEKKRRLRFILSPKATAAVRTLLKTDDQGKALSNVASLDDANSGDILEVCPEGMAFVQDVSRRISICNGAGLIIDYGSDKGTADTVRAYRRHKQCHVLSLPGLVDITADVDFSALKRAVDSPSLDCRSSDRCGAQVKVYGPVTQGQFLASMGAVQRVSDLVDDESTTDEQATELYFSLEKLMLPEQMGERYKVMAIASGITPAGFERAE